MQDTNPTEETPPQGTDKPSLLSRMVTRFGKKRLILAVVALLAGLWVITTVMSWFDTPKTPPVAVRQVAAPAPQPELRDAGTVKEPKPATPPDVHRATAEGPKDAYSDADVASRQLPSPSMPAAGHGAGTGARTHAPPAATGEYSPYGTAGRQPAPEPVPIIRGVAFVDAVTGPLGYEIDQRFWGWRPNDILDVTDNVNNFQLGVLEVTRRTAVVLAERISRTGSTAAFDKDLESAMNWLMIRPTQYWFPSPESMYGDALKAMESYKQRIIKGGAPFHTRSDNLIPLLIAYEDLLGSSDENLVKHSEADGSHVSFFKSDDYFFYAKGVATAMHSILEAVAVDFQKTLESRRGVEVLQHAIESLEYAMSVDPLVITNSDLSGILANHRANMAAPISHARFYLGVLIKTLST